MAGRHYLTNDSGETENRSYRSARVVRGTGLPNVVVNQLTQSADGTLVAATHGRGIWTITTPAPPSIYQGGRHPIGWRPLLLSGSPIMLRGVRREYL
jgi:hypothetical protein